MSLENEIVLIEFHKDANIGVLFTDTITFQGQNPRPEDGMEYGLVECNYITPACERWGIIVDTPWMEIPIFADEQMVIRVLESEPHDDYVDCELVETEYSEFIGSLCRVPKTAVKILNWMPE